MVAGYKSKILPVAAVLMMITAGIGIIVMNDEGTEAVTTQTPLASVVMDGEQIYTAYNNGQSSYAVAYGSYISISAKTLTQASWTVESVTSTYGGTAGLTLSNSNLRGYINQSGAGTVTIGMEYYDEGEDVVDRFYITLAVLDVSSSESNQYTSLNLPLTTFVEYGLSTLSGVPFYVALGGTVDMAYSSYRIYGTAGDMEYIATTVPNGYGLSVSSNGITGTATQAGTITIEGTYGIAGSEESWEVEMVIVDNNPHADVRMIGGETWTYTPQTNMNSVISVSGTATSWISLSSGTVSGIAPTNTSVGQTYDLTITASTDNPSQNVTQTVTFTVDPQITLTVPSAVQEIQYGNGTTADIVGSNFEGGSRNIYALSGGTGYTINAQTGVITYSLPSSGTVTITALSPYTYTSGVINMASDTITFEVSGRLAAYNSGTLYLVTGKTVPNTVAETVTLTHNNVGAGTYTWTMVDSDNSGVTVASDGTLGGRPGDVGEYSVEVRCTSVVDGVTQTAETTIDVVIVQQLVFTTRPIGTIS